MSGTNFENTMEIPANKAFVAEGTVEKRYEGLTRMYVGVVQLTTTSSGNLEISGAAYGMGAPEWKQSLDPKNPGREDGWEAVLSDDGTPTSVQVRRWAMELRGDYEHPLHPGPAVGFVLGEMPGGRVTGWIEKDLTLTAAPATQFAVETDKELAYRAVLSADQKKAVDGLLTTLEEQAKKVAAADEKARKAEEDATALATQFASSAPGGEGGSK